MQPKNVEDIYPLSPMQQLMLLHSLSSPSADTLRNQFCFDVEGELEPNAFRRAWELVLERHPALRNVFVWEGLPEPVQATRKKVELPFEVVDLRGCGESEQTARLTQLRAADRALAFRLTKAPLMRVTLALLTGRRSLLIWSNHHLILDRWCFGPIFGDLLDAYDCYRSGVEPSLERPGLFRDYIAWISNQSRAEAEAYWRNHLAGLRAPSLLAPLAPAATQRSLGLAEALLPRESLNLLNEAVKAAGVSLASALQGATALTLAANTMRTDVAFGLSVSGRPPALPRVETAVGCFINNVPVRTKLVPEQTVRDWLRSLQAAQGARARFEYVSPAEIAAWSEMPEGSPLFDVLLLIAAELDGASSGSSLRLRPVEGTMESAYPLLLAVGEEAEGLRLRAVYDQASFEKARAAAILDDLLEKLRAVVEGLTGPLGDLLPQGLGSAAAQGAELARLRPVSGGAPTLPRTELEHQLSAIWRLVLGTKSRDIHADFYDLGGSSLSALRLIDRIEELTGKRLAVTALLQYRTVASLAAALTSSGAAPEPSLIAQLRTGDPTRFAPLFFFEVDLAVRIARGLDPSRPVYGMIARHLLDRPIGKTTLEAVAGEYVDEILSVQPSGPFLLGGYCYAGTLTFEMARQLEAKGRRPELLVALETSFSIPLRTYLPYLLRERAPLHLKTWAAKRVAQWRQQDQRQTHTTQPDTPADLEQREREIAAAVTAYRPGPFGGDVLAIFAAETPAAPDHPRVSSWRNFATGSLRAVNVATPHVKILEDEALHEVARKLEAHLARPEPAP